MLKTGEDFFIENRNFNNTESNFTEPEIAKGQG